MDVQRKNQSIHVHTDTDTYSLLFINKYISHITRTAKMLKNLKILNFALPLW